MNLRENKMDQFETQSKKSFFGMSKKTPEIKKPEQVSQQEHIAQATIGAQGELPQRDQWVRKEAEGPVTEEKPDYQEHYEHIEEHSQYIKDHLQDVVIHWRGPEFEHYPHDRQWYVGAALVLCAIIVYAIFTNGIIMAIVFILVGLTGYLLLSRPQKVIDFAITYDGVLIGDEMYDYDNIKSFWIFYEPPHTRVISLHLKGQVRPYLHIPLHQIDPVVIHENLSQFIPEIEQEQSIIDTIERLLRM
jgi:hypothetical protein